MAVAAVIGSPSGAINYTFTTDSIGDWASVANGTYFYDKTDKLVHFKDDSGAILELFTASGGSAASGVHALVINSGSPIHGQLTYAALSTTSQVANRMFLYPFIPAKSFTATDFFIQVSSGLSGALGKILIYSDVNGNPSALLYESASFNLSLTGAKTATTSFSFIAGTTYWLAFWGDSNPQVYTMPSSSMLTFRNTGAVPSPFSGIAGTYIYGSAPSVITTTTIINSACPFIGITPA